MPIVHLHNKPGSVRSLENLINGRLFSCQAITTINVYVMCYS